MKLSASIYSSTSNDLGSLIRELDEHRIDFFHIDCKDDPAAFDDIESIRHLSKTPIDLHLITAEPGKYMPFIRELGVEYVTIQYENLQEAFYPEPVGSTQFGLALISTTPVKVFESYRNHMKFVLFMTTTPGESGGVFNEKNFLRIRQFKKKFPSKKIHVDGGVNEEVSFILRNLGVNTAVTGSYLFDSSYVGAALLNLKSDEIKSHYHVKDFMITKDELPLQLIDRFDFKSAIQYIENYNYGFTLIVDKDGKLEGITSNADIRRGILAHLDHLDKITASDILNKRPVIIEENRTISELMKLVKRLRFPVLFIPVVDRNHYLTGAVTFNNLIKGEA